MSIAGRKTKTLLNGEEIFMLWYELDSLRKVSLHLANAGIISINTGKPHNSATISNSAIRWVLENPDEARPYFQKKLADFAFDDNAWNEFLVRKAARIYNTSKERFIMWIDRRKFGTKYQHIYAKRFGLK